jgi:hypothetical protein
VSLRRFGGWEPRERTAYEVDDAGRVLASITVREPEWTEGERAWMLALGYYEATLCRKCGTPLAESTDIDNHPDLTDSPYQYVAEDPAQCLCCLVLLRSERKWAEAAPDEASSMIHTAVLVARPPRKPRAKKGQVQRA